MKKVAILLVLVGITFRGQTQYQNNKYPNIDSLKTILYQVLTMFQANEKISFLDGDIPLSKYFPLFQSLSAIIACLPSSFKAIF